MAYVVKIETGKGKKRTVSQSIPLSSKEKVRRWVKRNPVGRNSTEVTIRNTRKKTTKKTTKAGASTYGWTPKY
jgi:hypothetical protein